jgi:hypothetical protein
MGLPPSGVFRESAEETNRGTLRSPARNTPEGNLQTKSKRKASE